MATLVPRTRVVECASALAGQLGAPRDEEHERAFGLVLGAAAALETAEGALASRLVGPPGDGREALRRGIGMHDGEGRAVLEATLRTLKFTMRHVRATDGGRALQAPGQREFGETLAEQRLANGVPEGPAPVLLGALALACLPTRTLRRVCCERYLTAMLCAPLSCSSEACAGGSTRPGRNANERQDFLARMLDPGIDGAQGLQLKQRRADIAQALLAALGRAAVLDPLHYLIEIVAGETPVAALRDAYALSIRRAMELAREAEKAAVLLPQERAVQGGSTRACLEALSAAVLCAPARSPLQAACAPGEAAADAMLHDTARLLRSLVARQMRGPRYQTLPDANELAWRLLSSPPFSSLALATTEAAGDDALACQVHALDAVFSAAAGGARRAANRCEVDTPWPSNIAQTAEAQDPAAWRWVTQAHVLTDLLANH